jgi:hypothetical protein
MRSGKSLLVLAVLFGGLLAYLYFVDADRPLTPAGEQRDKVFAGVESSKIQELQVTGSAGETAALRRDGDDWRLTAPVEGRADDSEVSGITSNLESLEIQAVVDEEPTDLEQYGLQEPRVRVAFKADGDTTERRLLLGIRTPTGGDLYARSDDATRVFLVPAYLETSFDKTPFDLRDKTVLRFERDKVDRVEIAHGKERVALAKADGDWRLVTPVQAPADSSAVESLVTRLQSAQMRSIAAEDETDLRAYGLVTPAATVTLGAGSARATLQFGRPTSGESKSEAPSGDVFARDASGNRVVTIGADLLTDVTKTAADFRRKDVFLFRSWNARRVELVRGEETFTFEKRKGDGEDAAETWHRVAPEAGDVDATKVETLLSRLSDLRAQSFVPDQAKAGLSAPVLTASVHFDEDKQERARFGRVGGHVFSARDDEPGAAQLDANAFDEAMKALDELR